MAIPMVSIVMRVADELLMQRVIPIAPAPCRPRRSERKPGRSLQHRKVGIAVYR